MRLSVGLLALTVAVPALAADTGRGLQVQTVPEPVLSRPNINCPNARRYVAQDRGVYRGQKLAPKKLTELPPGTAYMAVLRHIGDCDSPLTMVEYRGPHR
jgi:hypothetical protein